MAKDYKSYSSKKKKTKQKGNKKLVVLWLVVIALIVLFAFGLRWLSQKSSKPSTMKTISVKPQEQPKPKPATKKNQVKFEFYNMLPNQNVNLSAVPNAQTQTNRTLYILQVASLKNFNDADEMKAKLLLNGFNVSVKKILVGNNVWYRVQVGPFSSVQSAQNAQAILKKERYSSVIRKMNSK